MKRFYTIATALLLVAGTFTSCTKDLDEVSVMSASTSQDVKGGKTINENQKTDSGLTLNFSKENPTVGEKITLTASVSEGVSAGKLRIEEPTGDVLNPWNTVAEVTVSQYVKSVSYDFTANTAGDYNFRAHYIPSNGAGFSQAALEKTVTYVNDCTGADLTAQLISKTPAEGDLTEYKVAFTLTSCTAYSNVKLQGGVSATITGSVEATSTDGSTATINYNNRNAVVSFAGLNLTEGYSNTFTVTFRMANADKESPIGDWTAKVGDLMIAEATL